MAVSPNGQFAYATNFVGRRLGVHHQRDHGCPDASPRFALRSGERSPDSVTVHPNGQFAYAANFDVPGDVSAYTINATTGALTPVPGSPFAAAGIEPVSVAVSQNGQFAYVANTDSNNVSAYTINATTGALTPVLGSPFAAGSFPFSVTTTAPASSCKHDDEERDRDERGDGDEHSEGDGDEL